MGKKLSGNGKFDGKWNTVLKNREIGKILAINYNCLPFCFPFNR